MKSKVVHKLHNTFNHTICYSIVIIQLLHIFYSCLPNSLYCKRIYGSLLKFYIYIFKYKDRNPSLLFYIIYLILNSTLYKGMSEGSMEQVQAHVHHNLPRKCEALPLAMFVHTPTHLYMNLGSVTGSSNL
jgi:hypothetical protein